MTKFYMKPLMVAVALSVTSLAGAQDDSLEEVVVTGFRGSIQAALDNKRDAVNTRESIVAEDIGKMPDLNLSESLQRVPGVAINRQGGEGRQISMRGLGAQFTRVTMNGMEVPSSTGGLDSAGGINNNRAFDFQVFSSELFTRIDLQKTSTAKIEEGGLAGTVDLYTMRPLDKPGLNFVADAKIGYMELSETTNPRLTLTYSDSNADETIGWMLAVNSAEAEVYQDGFGTVRWAPATNNGATWGVNNTSYSDAELESAYYPRLPRQDSFHHNKDRLGISAAIQFRPTDNIEFGLNFVNSEYTALIDSYNSFAQFRSQYQNLTVNSVTLAPEGSGMKAVAGSFSDVVLRTESRRMDETTEFQQITADLKWDISDNLILTGMYGTAKSDYHRELYRANMDTVTGSDFSYDFTGNANVAAIQYSIDVTDPANYVLRQSSLNNLSNNDLDRKNDTFKVDLEWSLNDESVFTFGVVTNDREVDSRQFVPSPVDMTALDLASISKIYTYSDIGGYGSGTQLNFLGLDFDAAIAATQLAPYTLQQTQGGASWNVQEETLGYYVDYDLNTEIAGHGLRINAGVRFVETDTSATGYLADNSANTETNTYDNTLPSINVAFDATDDLILRLGVSQSITRPGLFSLVPSKAYGVPQLTVAGGNSQLEPMESDNLDLGLEWYFSEDAILAFAFFQKDIDSFISSPTQPPSSLRPEDVPVVQFLNPSNPEYLTATSWIYSTSANTPGTKMDGWEIAYQQSFTSLPGFWGNFGFLGNYSHVEGETQVLIGGVPTMVPLLNMSENSWNATIFYEVDSWGARFSMNNRDDYTTRNPGRDQNRTEGTTGPTHVDLSAFWNINEMFALTFEVINITDESERLFTDGIDGSMNLIREYNETGRQFFLGARFSL